MNESLCVTAINPDAWHEPETHWIAARICGDCGSREACLEAGVGAAASGTWGGTWLVDGRPARPRRSPRAHEALSA